MKELLKKLNKEKRTLNNRIDSITVMNMSETALTEKRKCHSELVTIQTEINRTKKAIKEAKL